MENNTVVEILWERFDENQVTLLHIKCACHKLVKLMIYRYVNEI